MSTPDTRRLVREVLTEAAASDDPALAAAARAELAWRAELDRERLREPFRRAGRAYREVFDQLAAMVQAFTDAILGLDAARAGAGHQVHVMEDPDPPQSSWLTVARYGVHAPAPVCQCPDPDPDGDGPRWSDPGWDPGCPLHSLT